VVKRPLDQQDKPAMFKLYIHPHRASWESPAFREMRRFIATARKAGRPIAVRL